MNQNMKIKTYWKPQGESKFVEIEATLFEAIEKKVWWAEMVIDGLTYIVRDFTNCPNPGTMIVIANVI